MKSVGFRQIGDKVMMAPSLFGKSKNYSAAVLALIILFQSFDVETAGAAGSKPIGTKIQSNGLQLISDIKWWEHRDKNASLHVIVNKSLQQAKIYANGKFVSLSNVSTGKPGHDTPGGIFSILGKRRTHHSNIYSRAPMPFMQRLTWSGIALHESKSVPAYPASHGCVRLPAGFANNLFQYTNIGAQVIITDLDVSPNRFSSKKMFEIKQPELLASAKLRLTTSDEAVGSILASARQNVENQKPLRVLITRRSGREKTAEIQSILTELKYLKGDIDGWMGPETGRAIVKFQKDYRHRATGSLTPELLGQLYRATGKGKPKLAHLYVRQNQKPIFDAAIEVSDPDKSFGTHHFMAIGASDKKPATFEKTHWVSVTIEDTWWKNKPGKVAIDGSIITLPSTPLSSRAKEALERFVIPIQLHQRVSELMISGSTIIISDQGLSKETGKGTDFIVLTPQLDGI